MQTIRQVNLQSSFSSTSPRTVTDIANRRVSNLNRGGDCQLRYDNMWEIPIMGDTSILSFLNPIPDIPDSSDINKNWKIFMKILIKFLILII